MYIYGWKLLIQAQATSASKESKIQVYGHYLPRELISCQYLVKLGLYHILPCDRKSTSNHCQPSISNSPICIKIP